MSNKRILIVDDNETTLLLLEDKVKRLGPGYQAVLAKNIFAALAQIQKHPFDLVVIDYILPGTNGLELARIARQILPDVQIVMMTGQDPDKMQAEARSRHVNFDSYMTKPFTLAQLREVVKHLEIPT